MPINDNDINLGDGFFAEPRGNLVYAIKHVDGGLHMADIGEIAMIESIARLQAQVDALAAALASAVEAIDLLEDSILGVRRNWTPDGDGYYSLQPHKGEMDRLTKAKKQGEAALAVAVR